MRQVPTYTLREPLNALADAVEKLRDLNLDRPAE